MSIETATARVPSIGLTKMEDRKRPSSTDDTAAPPNKRQNTQNNDMDQAEYNPTFGSSATPWSFDLQTYQKDAILRSMKEHKREKQRVEKELVKATERAAELEAKSVLTDAFVTQIIDELAVATGTLPSTSSSDDQTSHISAILSSDQGHFEELASKRFERLRQHLRTILSSIPQPKSEVEELQKSLNIALSREKELAARHGTLERRYNELEEKSDDFKYRWSIAKTQLAKSTSQTKIYIDLQTRPPVSSTEKEAPKAKAQENGDVRNGHITNGVISEEVEIAKKAALAELQKRADQVKALEDQNLELNKQVTSVMARLNSLSDDDYARTELFKALKMQQETVINRVNELEAANVQLRKDAEKLTSERASYRIQIDDEYRVKCEESEAQVAKAEADLQRIRSERDVIHQQRAVIEGNQTKHDVAMREIQTLNDANEERINALEQEVKRLQLQAKEIQPDNDSLDDLADQSESGLRTELLSLRGQHAALNMELGSMSTAVAKFRAAAQKKVQEWVAMEQEVQRLREAKHKLDSNRFSEKTVLEAKKVECENMRRQSSKSAEIIAQLKDTEARSREIIANTEKQIAEYRSQLETLTQQNRELSQKLETQNTLASAHTTQIAELKKTLAAKDTDLTKAISRRHTAEAEAAGVASKLESEKKRTEALRSNKTPGDEEKMLKMYKTVAFCSTCNFNIKDTVLTQCGHVFCDTCIKTRTDSRQRKCPICMKAFGKGDTFKVHMV